MSAASAKVHSFVKSVPPFLIGGVLSILVGVTQSTPSTYFDAFYILVGLGMVGQAWLYWRDERPKKLGVSHVTFAIAFGVLAYFSRTAEPFIARLSVIACLWILAVVGYRSWRR
ncbi:hypothetical protein [Haloarcula salinisoli]|uniref:Uncharacterized protein n=1 Tax=Haloarcula salinisoli TaxID=2487746 RepID=A0A8J8C955_9EURY|nr:hypothetical protein [Halomicroarcula salinisoli]MBX0286504.1 hypothetical protein [Halomicroarcula salinisoli]MBX0303854.1 hypothetical protein [Halomicroarcula salinisoli]